MREISALTLSLTERCNFSCSYCPQRGRKRTLAVGTVRAFLDLIAPRLAGEVRLGFTGGEPLLAWPLVEAAVAHLRGLGKSRFRLALTSNGSLLSSEHIRYFRENRFDLVLSYDGLAQQQRERGSAAAVEAALSALRELYPEGYTINSVFTPKTVPLLAGSMERMLGQGHRRLRYALDMATPWQERDLDVLRRQLERLAELLAGPRRTGSARLENFEDDGREGVFACFAGRDRLALLPDGSIWGCSLFYDLLGRSPGHPDYRKYCFGKLGNFAARFKGGFPRVSAHYRDLRQDYFLAAGREPCGLCERLRSCRVCPVVAALASGQIGVIPSWACRIRAIQADSRRRVAAGH